MNQAILIVAHNNILHLIDLINSLTDEYYFFIHIDQKSKINTNVIQQLTANENVVVVSRRYRVNWGGLNLTKAILFLAEEALKNPTIEYIHLLSGADFPIKSSSDIAGALNSKKGKEFIENFPLSNSTWYNNGMDRLLYYQFTDQFNVSSFYGKTMVNLLVLLQKLFGIRRQLDKSGPELYGGSTWWTLSKDALSYVLEYLRTNPGFLKRFEYTMIADEIIFQTIIMNSPFRDKVINRNFRMILWKSEDSVHPAVLDETDYSTIVQSNDMFARKFVYPESEMLLNLIKGEIHSLE